jgi:hypothetical protein
VSQVAVAPVNQSQFVTFVRNSSGNLEAISWLHTTGGQITRQKSVTAGAIKKVVAAPANYTQPNALFSAVINGSGDLEMIGWSVDTSGNITRTGSQNAEAASQLAICDVCFIYVGSAFTAVRNFSGNLGGELWSIPPASLQEQAGYDTGSAISSVAATLSNYADQLVTAARGSDGNLHIQIWDATY